MKYWKLSFDFFLGYSYATVQVEIKNEGDDAYKRELYGDTIIVERRITESTSATLIKDQQGSCCFYFLLD